MEAGSHNSRRKSRGRYPSARESPQKNDVGEQVINAEAGWWTHFPRFFFQHITLSSKDLNHEWFVFIYDVTIKCDYH